MTREEMSQFVDRFSGAPEGPAREGQELEVEPGAEETIDPNRTIPDPISGVRQSPGVGRTNRPTTDDGIGGNRQGGGTPPPPQLRPLLDAYRKRISGSTAPATRPPAGGGESATSARPLE
jgi:hypothetical protein